MNRNRLRNIEATEKAKREMEERMRNETKTKRRPEDEDFAAARCTLLSFLCFLNLNGADGA